MIRWYRHSAVVFVALLSFSAGIAAASEKSAANVFEAVIKLSANVPGAARTAKSLGTQRQGHAVVIDSGGLALTIGYLILEAESVTLTTNDGREVPAQIVAYDHDTGFGLVRAVRPLGIDPVRLGSSKDVSDGAKMLAIGYGGTERAIGVNVVSRRDFAGYWEYLLENAIFTAPPFPGFGGAALIDPQGRLVGIGSLIIPNAAAPNSHSPGNMFVPIDALKPIMADLLDQGRSERRRNPWIGVYTAEQSGFLMVQRVAAEGPSDRAGVEAGDIIVSVGGQPVSDQMDFYRKMWSLGGPGTEIDLALLKPGSGIRELRIESTDRYRWLRLSKGD